MIKLSVDSAVICINEEQDISAAPVSLYRTVIFFPLYIFFNCKKTLLGCHVILTSSAHNHIREDKLCYAMVTDTPTHIISQNKDLSLKVHNQDMWAEGSILETMTTATEPSRTKIQGVDLEEIWKNFTFHLA